MNSQEELSNSASLAPEDISSSSQTEEIPGKRLILTLVRHGQSESNVGQHSANIHDPLTPLGRNQAEQLGKELSSTHIDHLISSPYLRAMDTARSIGENNTERPDLKPEGHVLIIEQDHGPAVEAARRSGNWVSEYQLRTGKGALSAYSETPVVPSRIYKPPGGESLESVAERAQHALLQYLRSYGASFASMPDVPNDSADLIDGVPHAVVVSHNILLTEFYEAMLFFNEPSKRYITPVHFRNASWARYIVFYDGKHLEFKTMKEPH
ncbi:histidine phosphatase superfamily [Desarmillaria tabescens]|uniref:Histidine phosphatase superfamily n=1 Tax=Armillaria tabescens TaxID=1929756 RepID=A0AA39N291_ARMTA|nr:histidine phosphatase superfamily [Desarmillaria tabescens]KAK0455267.1 histidine phosphatase superfamily [Desarmillaria tabescens]